MSLIVKIIVWKVDLTLKKGRIDALTIIQTVRLGVRGR
jgi:hypothetical protein